MATPYRALFISDVHLGTRWAQAPKLLELLEHVRAETVYLDIPSLPFNLPGNTLNTSRARPRYLGSE